MKFRNDVGGRGLSIARHQVSAAGSHDDDREIKSSADSRIAHVHIPDLSDLFDRFTPIALMADTDHRRMQLCRNLEAIQARIANAATQTSRDPDDVCLIAVTKYVDEELTRDLVSAGCKHVGESRPQELWQKAEALSDLEIDWHQIGHLQRNKLRRTLPLVSLVHSVDSVRLVEAINELQSQLDPSSPQSILLEVNTSGDAAKHGFQPTEMQSVIERVASKSHVKARGLMCMAGLGTDQAEARRDFAKLRTLRDQLQEAFPEEDLTQLSMGMSADFEAAIAEGATLVRVGSSLFEGLD